MDKRIIDNHGIKDIDALNIAIIIPCYNEELTIKEVIKGFKKVAPSASIYVIDNNSSDKTADIAFSQGAIVIREPMQGKGYAVRRAFNEIEADIYVMVDGDATYSPDALHKLLLPVLNKDADMVVATRLEECADSSFRKFHRFGNRLITGIINLLFNAGLTDVLSGYRVFSRKFVKAIPLISKGFEVETELTLHAVDGDFLIKEIPVPYSTRPSGSSSKLNTWKDGFIILFTIISIFKDYRPLLFFSLLSLLFLIAGLLIGIPVLLEFKKTHYITKVPSAILASALEILSFQMIGVGFILDTMARIRRGQLEIWKKSERRPFVT